MVSHRPAPAGTTCESGSLAERGGILAASRAVDRTWRPRQRLRRAGRRCSEKPSSHPSPEGSVPPCPRDPLSTRVPHHPREGGPDPATRPWEGPPHLAVPARDDRVARLMTAPRRGGTIRAGKGRLARPPRRPGLEPQPSEEDRASAGRARVSPPPEGDGKGPSPLPRFRRSTAVPWAGKRCRFLISSGRAGGSLYRNPTLSRTQSLAPIGPCAQASLRLQTVKNCA